MHGGQRFDKIVSYKFDEMEVALRHNWKGLLDVESWTNIVQLDAGAFHTEGLKSDGTVVAVGSLVDIMELAAGVVHTVGMRSDGTVVGVGPNLCGQLNVDNWNDIALVASGWVHTVGLVSGGTVVAVGKNNYRQCNLFDWSTIFTKHKELKYDRNVCRRLP